MEKVRSYNAADLVAAATVRWRQYCGEAHDHRKPAPVWAYSAREVRRFRVPEPRRIVYTTPGNKSVTRMDVRFRARRKRATVFERLVYVSREAA